MGAFNDRTIYACIIADVTGIVASGADAREDADAATIVAADTGRIMATSTAQSAGQPTSELALDVCAGDIVRFYAKSGSNNFEGAVLIQGIWPIGGNGILQGFELVKLQRIAITPAADAGVLSRDLSEQEFWFWQCAIAGGGPQRCRALLALYDRDEQGRPSFAGLFRWDLELTVNLTSLPPATVQTEGGTS